MTSRPLGEILDQYERDREAVLWSPIGDTLLIKDQEVILFTQDCVRLTCTPASERVHTTRVRLKHPLALIIARSHIWSSIDPPSRREKILRLWRSVESLVTDALAHSALWEESVDVHLSEAVRSVVMALRDEAVFELITGEVKP